MGLFETIGSVLTGPAGAIIGGVADAGFGALSNAQNNKTQMELAKYNWDRQIEFYNMQNEYNSPVNQMQRFADAGLNPNLIYGQGSNGNSSFSPSSQLPKTSAYRPNILGAVQAANQASLLESQKQNLEADSDLKFSQSGEANARTRNTMVDTLNKQLEHNLKQIQLLREQKQFDGTIEKLELENQELRSKISNLNSSTDLNNQLHDFNATANPKRLEILGQELTNAIKSGKLIDANTAKSAADAALSYALKEKALSEAALNELSSEMLKLDLAVRGNTLQAEIDSKRYLAYKLGVDLNNARKEGKLKDDSHLENYINTWLKAHGVDPSNAGDRSVSIVNWAKRTILLNGFTTDRKDVYDLYKND